jgi:hypothetical protein
MEDTKSVGQFLQFVISSNFGNLKSFKLTEPPAPGFKKLVKNQRVS